jgi:hypothetical protein
VILVPGKYFDAAPALTAPAPTQLNSKAKNFKQTKANMMIALFLRLTLCYSDWSKYEFKIYINDPFLKSIQSEHRCLEILRLLAAPAPHPCFIYRY